MVALLMTSPLYDFMNFFHAQENCFGFLIPSSKKINKKILHLQMQSSDIWGYAACENGWRGSKDLVNNALVLVFRPHPWRLQCCQKLSTIFLALDGSTFNKWLDPICHFFASQNNSFCFAFSSLFKQTSGWGSLKFT